MSSPTNESLSSEIVRSVRPCTTALSLAPPSLAARPSGPASVTRAEPPYGSTRRSGATVTLERDDGSVGWEVAPSGSVIESVSGVVIE